MSHAEEFPEHSRTSCSDEDPCNADPKGHYCWRCNALLFDRHDKLVADAVAQIERAEKWKAIAINMHTHAPWVRSMDRPLLEEAIRSTRRSDHKLAALYAAMLQEHP